MPAPILRNCAIIATQGRGWWAKLSGERSEWGWEVDESQMGGGDPLCVYCTAFNSANFTDLHSRFSGTTYALCISILPTVHMHHIDNML